MPAPMSEAASANFREITVPDDAADKVASGAWVQQGSLERSRAEFAQPLPDGLATVDRHLYRISAVSGEAAIGRIWVAVMERRGGRVAFVYAVVIAPEHRRKGHAMRAFAALEGEVRAMHLPGVGLHVFGHNEAAIALYRKLGYRITDIQMFKEPGPADALEGDGG